MVLYLQTQKSRTQLKVWRLVVGIDFGRHTRRIIAVLEPNFLHGGPICPGVSVTRNARRWEGVEGLFHLLRCFWLLLPNAVLVPGIGGPSNQIWCDRVWSTARDALAVDYVKIARRKPEDGT
jgi:hypothetical protein